MTDFRHFDAKEVFTAIEAAALIAGFDPNDPDAPQHRAVPVLALLTEAYRIARVWCAGHPMTAAEFKEWREQLFPDKLVSVHIENYPREQKEPWPGDPYRVWELPKRFKGDYGDLEKQRFTRAELHRWLKVVNLPSKYQFVMDSRSSPPGETDATGHQSPAAQANRPRVPEEWKVAAQSLAKQIIERQSGRDLFPSQVAVAEEVARRLREAEVLGPAGKPLSASYIKRHALAGISSARSKQRSTSTHRGK